MKRILCVISSQSVIVDRNLEKIFCRDNGSFLHLESYSERASDHRRRTESTNVTQTVRDTIKNQLFKIFL